MLEIHDDIINFINDHWRPNQDDSFIVVEKNSDRYNDLVEWFQNNKDHSIDVGPFVGIKPYGMFDDQDNPDTRTEFLFIYDDIDKTKLESQHLML